MIRIYTGQYKNESTLTEFNLVRYTTICLVLDYFCLMNSQKIDMEVALSKLVDSVLIKSSFKDTDSNRVWIETAIGNMQMMGQLIETDAGLLTITDLGLSAYSSQLYHQTAASLYEARASRQLAKIAIYVALAGIGLTLILQLCRCC